MKVEKFLPRSGSLREQLDGLYEDLTELVDQGLADKETGHAVEGAAGAVWAAKQLLEMAEKACDDQEFCP